MDGCFPRHETPQCAGCSRHFLINAAHRNSVRQIVLPTIIDASSALRQGRCLMRVEVLAAETVKRAA